MCRDGRTRPRRSLPRAARGFARARARPGDGSDRRPHQRDQQADQARDGGHARRARPLARRVAGAREPLPRRRALLQLARRALERPRALERRDDEPHRPARGAWLRPAAARPGRPPRCAGRADAGGTRRVGGVRVGAGAQGSADRVGAQRAREDAAERAAAKADARARDAGRVGPRPGYGSPGGGSTSVGGATVTPAVASAVRPSAATARTVTACPPGTSTDVSHAKSHGEVETVARTVPSTTNSTRPTGPVVSACHSTVPCTLCASVSDCHVTA